jgi:hypothetical protein
VKAFTAAHGQFAILRAGKASGTRMRTGMSSMNASKTMIVVRKVYDNVECALWAGLLSFVIYFATIVAPSLPEMARRAESIRALRATEENGAYCERWGMKPGTREHTACTMDIRELRAKIGQELADEGSIL